MLICYTRMAWFRRTLCMKLVVLVVKFLHVFECVLVEEFICHILSFVFISYDRRLLFGGTCLMGRRTGWMEQELGGSRVGTTTHRHFDRVVGLTLHCAIISAHAFGCS